jgi:hypothetical protein
MLIGERGFAAQVIDTDGRALSFDDPGCLLAWTARHAAPPRAVWFHHLRDDRWLRGDDVAFVRVDRSPMGYGLGAVEAGATGAITLAAARGEVAR